MKNVDIVIHAAALKHVDMAEYNPFEYIKTNVLGAENIISCAIENNVKKVIALSTDKASSPANLYGATKLMSDKLFIAANNYKGSNEIKFSVVRYGNVMGSRGSVVPLFLKQKKEKFITVTDSSMTRFNITLQEGVDFVIFAIQDMLGGEIFIPKLKSYSLKDLIKAIAPRMKVKHIGLRAGEKKHEEMISLNDSFNTVEFKKHYVIVPNSDKYRLNINKYLKIKKKSKKVKNDFSYNSKTNFDFLNSEEINRIINNCIKDIEY